MKVTIRVACFVVVVSLTCISVISAAVFNVTEPNRTRSSDLPLYPVDFGDPEGPDGLYYFDAVADVGTNRVKGSFSCMEFYCWDKGDSFKFEVPAGLSITEVSWIVKYPILRITGPGGTIIDSYVGTGSISTYMGPGIYSVTFQNGTVYGQDNYSGSWDIQFECSAWVCECDKANLDGQGKVDFRDMAILAAGWQKDSTGDIDGDGQTNMSDLKLLAGCWLSDCGV